MHIEHSDKRLSKLDLTMTVQPTIPQDTLYGSHIVPTQLGMKQAKTPNWMYLGTPTGQSYVCIAKVSKKEANTQ